MVKVAVAGVGGYGSELVKHIGRAKEMGAPVELVAGVRSRRERFAEVNEKLEAQGVPLFSSIDEMFEKMRGKADAVFIPTSIDTHLEYVGKALKHGYHMQLEKPAAATVQEIDQMDQAVRQAGKICLVGFQGVHGAEINLIKDRLVSGKLGKIRKITCYSGSPRNKEYYTRNNWAGRLMMDGKWCLDSPSINALAHQINNMLYFASPKPGGYAVPQAVRAELYVANAVDSHDTAAIEIQTDVGCNCYFLASHAAEEETSVRIVVDCENGTASYGMARYGAKIAYNDGTKEEAPPDRDSSAKMVANLVEAVEKNDTSVLRCSLVDSRQLTLAVDGAHESSVRVHRIDDKHLKIVDQGTDSERAMVPGLNDMLKTCAEKGCLFGDLDSPPAWVVPSKAYDVRDYKEFPQQFQAE